MKRTHYKIYVLTLLCIAGLWRSKSAEAQYVTIIDRDGYYKVDIDYQQALEDGRTPYEIGKEYGERLLEFLPEAEARLAVLFNTFATAMHTKTCFRLTEESFNGLKDAGLPGNVLASLQSLQENVYCDGNQLGQAIGEKIVEAMGNSVSQDMMNHYFSLIGPHVNLVKVPRPLNEILSKIEIIKPDIPLQYREEIEGLASSFHGGSHDDSSDEYISTNELYFLHLIPDLFAMGCSAVSVYGDRSEDNSTITASVLDYPSGEMFSQIHAVTTIRNAERSVGFVGFLGVLAGTSVFNEDRVFLAHMDSKTPDDQSGPNNAPAHSIFFEMRQALENASTLREAADVLAEPQKRYTYGHVISIADADGAQVLEIDNVSGVRALRKDSSALHTDVKPWNIDSAVAAVNSFLLQGTISNHDFQPNNIPRWNSYVTLMADAGDTVSWEELKQIVSFDGENQIPAEGDGEDIYNQQTINIAVFRPADLRLELAFWPRGALQPLDDPLFVHVPLSFEAFSSDPLQEVFDSVVRDGKSDVSAATDYLSGDRDWLWGSHFTMMLLRDSDSEPFAFGIYHNEQYLELFREGVGAGARLALQILEDGSVYVNEADTGVDFLGPDFGLYVDSGEQRYYSVQSLHYDGGNHMRAYQGVGEEFDFSAITGNPLNSIWDKDVYLTAWELDGKGLKEYDDLVLLVERVSPVPEPSSCLSLGLGLLGVSLYRWKRWKRDI